MSKLYSSAMDLKSKISKLNLHKNTENCLGHLEDVYGLFLNKKSFPYQICSLQVKYEKIVKFSPANPSKMNLMHYKYSDKLYSTAVFLFF